MCIQNTNTGPLQPQLCAESYSRQHSPYNPNKLKEIIYLLYVFIYHKVVITLST